MQQNLFELTDEERQNELNKQEKTRDAVQLELFDRHDDELVACDKPE